MLQTPGITHTHLVQSIAIPPTKLVYNKIITDFKAIDQIEDKPEDAINTTVIQNCTLYNGAPSLSDTDSALTPEAVVSLFHKAGNGGSGGGGGGPLTIKTITQIQIQTTKVTSTESSHSSAPTR